MSLITTYQPLPISFTHGEGIWLYDEKGNQYLDSFSGIAVCGLGHAHPKITATIQKQAAKLMHVSNAFIIPQQLELAKKLTDITGMHQAFFCNSGAEANEAAIKLARLYGHQQKIENPSIVVMEGAFHGRTMGTLTASGSRKVQAGFEPLLSGFVRAPFNDFKALETIASNREDIVAVMLEPIQGERGILLADESYLRAIAALCKKHNWLFILDEVQTGNGRTGKWFDYMHSECIPDILTTAKGLGNGYPIGACLMNHKACNLFKPGNHGSTFGGNPLASAVALSVINVIEEEDICEAVSHHSIYLNNQLNTHLGSFSSIKVIRGKGFMIGIEFDRSITKLKEIALRHQLLINVTNENVLRLLPPLIMTKPEIDELVKRLSNSIDEFLNSPQ